jgi:ribA/ribD-fused uncharacterized protein
MTTPITRFAGEHAFLSNFYHAPFRLKERPEHWWPTAEHAFQAAKATSVFDFQKIMYAESPAAAKRLGRTIACVEGWDKIKRETMLRILLSKFDNGSVRLQQLIATWPAELIEGNTWHDLYWGAEPYTSRSVGPMFQASDGTMWVGENWLGRLLMVVRDVSR